MQDENKTREDQIIELEFQFDNPPFRRSNSAERRKLIDLGKSP